MLPRTLRSLLFAVLPVTALLGQGTSPSCTVTAVTPTVRAEGLTERLGDIVFSCTAPPGTAVTGNLSVFLNTNITNREFGDGVLDAALTVNGALANTPPRRGGASLVTFNGLQFAFPPTGVVEIRLSNLRADASALPASGGFFPGTPITARVAFSPATLLSFTRSEVTVGIPQRGLFATSQQTVVAAQLGSPLPESPITFTRALAARTFFATTRVTEAFATAFEPKQAGTDTGTRIVVRFSGYPSDARIFVPSLVAGSSASTPTAAGDFGGTISPGAYAPGSGTLALVRVQSTGPQGESGFYSNPISDELTEVPLVGGTGIAVFEVLDADPRRTESAQIPVFLGLPRSGSGGSSTVTAAVSFGPNGGTGYPRFTAVAAPTDCSVFSDCNAYVPKLRADPANTTFRLLQGGVANQQFLIYNEGGGSIMPFTTRVEYTNGSGWIRLDPEGDLVARPVRMVVIATPQMAPGAYRATVVIDAGGAGVARYNITLEVVALPPEPPAVPRPRVTQVLHGATFEAGPVARNAYYTLKGENLAGNNLSVTFDGKLARTTYTSANQINVLVPADLGSNTAQLVVSANGVSSTPVTVQVTDAYPGIFDPGILNQDGSVNSPTNPAPAGTFVQIYATGLLGPRDNGVIDARLHDVSIGNPPYAGPAPGIPGLQQVNLQIPREWPTFTTEVLLCTTATGTRTCSTPVKIHIRQTP